MEFAAISFPHHVAWRSCCRRAPSPLAARAGLRRLDHRPPRHSTRERGQLQRVGPDKIDLNHNVLWQLRTLAATIIRGLFLSWDRSTLFSSPPFACSAPLVHFHPFYTRSVPRIVQTVGQLLIMAGTPGQKRNAGHLSGPDTDAKKPKANGSITSFFGAPKPKAADPNSATSTPASRFNKEKWVASLTPEQRELLKLEIETLDESWLAQLKDEVVTPEFLSLKRFLKKERESGATIFPPENEIYSWYSRHGSPHDRLVN